MFNAVKLHEIKLYVLANGKTPTRFGFGFETRFGFNKIRCRNYNVLVLNDYLIFFYYIENDLKL